MIGNTIRTYWRDFSNDFYAESIKKKIKNDVLFLGIIFKIGTTIMIPILTIGIISVPANFIIGLISPAYANKEETSKIIIVFWDSLIIFLITITLLFISPYATKVWGLECFRQFTDKYRVNSVDEINDKDLGYGLVLRNLTLIKNIYFTPHSEIQLFETHIKLVWKYPLSNKSIWQKTYPWEKFSVAYSNLNIAPWAPKPKQSLIFTCETNKKSHFLWIFYPLANFSKFTGIQGWKARKRNRASNPDNFSDEKIDYEINRLKNSDCLKFNLNLFQHEPNTIVTILYYLEENHPTETILKEIHDEFYKITPPMEERIQIHNQSHEMQLIPFQHEAFKSGRITAGDMEKFGMQLNKMDRFFDKFKRKNK